MSILCGVTVCAQMVTSNLQGTVTDPSGAVVAGAEVIAASLETGLQRTATTNSEGFYRFNLLPRGEYEVRAAKTGFNNGTLSVVLTVGDTINANVVLKVAGGNKQ